MGNKLSRWVAVKDKSIPKHTDHIAEKLREIPIHDDESSCICISHLCSSSDGRTFWASDCDGCLTHLDKEGNVLTRVSIARSDGGTFTAITRGLGVMYVDFHNKALYKLCTDMSTEIFVSTGDWNPTAISSSRFAVGHDESLLVGMRKGYSCKITRYSKDGKSVQNIRKKSIFRDLYKSIDCITENINGDICVSDALSYSVVVVTGSGRYRFSYFGQKSQETFTPCGICTDVLGQILVCNDSFSFRPNCSSVHLLDKDGNFLCLLLKPELCPISPSAVCIDDEHNLLLGSRHSSYIVVYKYLQSKDLISSYS